jgi:SHS2 domain-containing protein
MKPYEFLSHPGDLKIRAHGRSLAEAFVNVARAMMEFMFGDVPDRPCDEWIPVVLDAPDRESLLVDWLSHILYLSTSGYRACTDYRIGRLDDRHLEAEIGSCEARAEDDIKAVTYHELDIRQLGDGWQVTVVCDI